MVEAQVCTHALALTPQVLQVEVISDAERFFALGNEWDHLADACGISHPFLSFTWLKTWWQSFGNGAELRVITIRENEELIAAAPLMIRQTRMCGIPVRRLESLYNFHTPRSDFLISKRADEAYELIWHQMASMDCDAILLAQLPKESPTLLEIESLAAANGWLAGRWSPPPSPYISLNGDYEQFQKTLTGHYRYNLRKRYDRMTKLAPVTVERITERFRVREAMQDGLRIEAAAWKGTEGTAMNSDPNVAEFYIRMAERAADRGWLELTFLKLGDKRIAFDYILRHGNAFCGVKIGYDPEYHTYSPGNMLLNLFLQDACGRGATEYDFLGIDDEWKFDWTKETRGHEWLYLFRDKLRPRLIHKCKFHVLPRLKKNNQLMRMRNIVLALPQKFK